MRSNPCKARNFIPCEFSTNSQFPRFLFSHQGFLAFALHANSCALRACKARNSNPSHACKFTLRTRANSPLGMELRFLCTVQSVALHSAKEVPRKCFLGTIGICYLWDSLALPWHEFARDGIGACFARLLRTTQPFAGNACGAILGTQFRNSQPTQNL